MRYVIALALVVGLGFVLLDGPLWLGIAIGCAVILLVNKLGDLAMYRSSFCSSRVGEMAWVIIAIALAGLAMTLYGTAKRTLMPKQDPPSYYGNP